MHNYLEVSGTSPSQMILAPSCNVLQFCSTTKHIYETTQKVYSLPNCEAAGQRDRRSNRQTRTDRICSEEKKCRIFSRRRGKQCSSGKKVLKGISGIWRQVTTNEIELPTRKRNKMFSSFVPVNLNPLHML